MQKNIPENNGNTCLKNESSNLKKIKFTIMEENIPSKRKIKEMSIQESAQAMQKLMESKIIVCEKRIKIISRSTGLQIGWRIKKEYEDGSKSNEAKYFK